MEKSVENNLKENLKKFEGKKVTIIQDGFLKSKYFLDSLSYFLEYDILNINDDESDNYLKINLNQIYKIENNDKKLKLYVDNDTIIILEI